MKRGGNSNLKNRVSENLSKPFSRSLSPNLRTQGPNLKIGAKGFTQREVPRSTLEIQV